MNAKNRRYDFICGVGSACILSQAMRESGLQYASFPFDWLSGPTFRQRIDTILSDFAGWFEKKDLQCVGNLNHFTHESYFNRHTGVTFPHDFDIGEPFDEMYERVREKYIRRIDRLYHMLSGSSRVLVVWLENPFEEDRPSVDDVRYAKTSLENKFTNTEFEFLIIDRAEDGQGNSRPLYADGVWRVSCGYRVKTDPRKSERPWDLEIGPICSVLSNFKAKDYRTREGRRRHAIAARKKMYAKYGAVNLVDYCLARAQVKMYKYAAKKLARWGVLRNA